MSQEHSTFEEVRISAWMNTLEGYRDSKIPIKVVIARGNCIAELSGKVFLLDSINKIVVIKGFTRHRFFAGDIIQIID
jgi:hypothetical protein